MPLNDERFLVDKSVVVTGAGAGIGRAIARTMAERGGNVVLVGRRLEPLEETAELIGSDGCTIMVADVRSDADTTRLMTAVRDLMGWIDVLVNNAGVFRQGPIHDTSTEAFDLVFETNVRGLFLMTKKAVPLMQGRPGANIINLSSIAGTRHDPNLGIYEASKAAVNTLTKVLAKELAPMGIRVNAIAPGPVDTEGLAGDVRDSGEVAVVKAEMSTMVPFGRLGRSEEIARLAAFLASPESDFISGSITSIDGGMGY